MEVEALNDWATVTSFIKGSIGFFVEEPEITDDFKQFLIMCGINWEKRVPGYQMIIIEQLHALISGYSYLTSRLKRIWLEQFDCGSRAFFGLKLKGSRSLEDFWNSNKLSDIAVGGVGVSCVKYVFRFMCPYRFEVR